MFFMFMGHKARKTHKLVSRTGTHTRPDANTDIHTFRGQRTDSDTCALMGHNAEMP